MKVNACDFLIREPATAIVSARWNRRHPKQQPRQIAERIGTSLDAVDGASELKGE
jgi:hypothetical protein